MPRPKGSQNKVTTEVKEQLQVSYTALNCSVFSLFVWNSPLITDSIKVI